LADTVETAIYALKYQTGDSLAQLKAVRAEAVAVALAADKMSASEENLNRSTVRLLGSLDKQTKAQATAADQLERVRRLYVDGVISADRYAAAVGHIERNYQTFVNQTNQSTLASRAWGGALSVATQALGAMGLALSVGTVVNWTRDIVRSTGDLDDQAQTLGVSTDALQAYRAAALAGGASADIATDAIRKYTKSAGEAIGGNTKMAEAFRALGLSASEVAGSPEASLPKVIEGLGKIESVTERARLETVLFGRAGQQVEQVLKSWADPIDELVKKYRDMGLIVSEDTIKRIDRATASWDLFWLKMRTGVVEFFDALSRGPSDFLIVGDNSFLKQPLRTTGIPLANAANPKVGDDGAQWEDLAKQAATAQAKIDKMFQESYNRVTEQLGDLAVKRIKAEQDAAYAILQVGRKARDQVAVDARLRDEETRRMNAELEKHYSEMYTRMLKDRYDKETAANEKSKKLNEAYWKQFKEAGLDAVKDFFLEFVETGRLNFGSLLAKMKRMWIDALVDMAKQGKLFGADGAFGGGAFGAQPGQTGYVGAGLSAAAMIAGAMQKPGGNSRISGALSGAASGAMMGSMILPGIGTAIGAIVGGIAGLISGSDKKSDMRAVATFGPGGSFTTAAQSLHESSDATIGLAQQAAKAIQDELAALRAAGVQFNSQIAGLTIGERDASTYQLVGGQKVSAGTVGNAADLASDALTALLKSAHSDDPYIQNVLKSGAPNMLEALRFAQGISSALAQITDPLKYAIDLWKREAQARLDMAAATGVEMAKVEQLNAALYKQVVNQVNGPAIAAIDSVVSQYAYGPASSASPKSQFAAATADFEKARSAAMTGGAAEAQAFAQAASTYLPFARDYMGTTVDYGKLESSTLSMLSQLKVGLQNPTMPDLTPTLVSGFTATVEATGKVESKLGEVAQELKLQGALLSQLINRFIM
jgi:hypothetical protein